MVIEKAVTINVSFLRELNLISTGYILKIIHICA